MSFYDRMSALALKQLTKYGQSVTLRPFSQGGGDYDPNTGAATPDGADGVEDESRKALVTDQPGSQIAQRFGQTLQNGTLLQSTDKWLYMDADGQVPKLQDHVIFDNTDFSIINVQVTSPGGTPILYLLVLRA